MNIKYLKNVSFIRWFIDLASRVVTIFNNFTLSKTFHDIKRLISARNRNQIVAFLEI